MIIVYRLSIVVVGLIVFACTNAPRTKHAESPTPVTVSLQGETRPPCNDQIVTGFYDITLAAFKNGATNVDIALYERDSYAFFRSSAESMGTSPEQLVEHARNIPKQMVQIVKDDPKVLDNCRNFEFALVGAH